VVRVRPLWVAIVLAVAGVLAASMALTLPLQPSGLPGPSLRLVASSDLRQYVAGEAVLLGLRLENLGAEPVVLQVPSTCVVSFVVYDSMARVVYDHTQHQACAQAITTVTLPPGGSEQYNFRWNQTTDAGAQVPPEATYFVKGVLLVPGVPLTSNEGVGFYVMRASGSGLLLRALTDKPAYLAGEPVRVTIRLTNLGGEELTLRSTTSCVVAFTISEAGGAPVYHSERHFGCLTVITRVTLDPGASEDYTFVWDQRDDNGVPVPTPGTYRVDGILLAEGAPIVESQAAEFTISVPPWSG